MDVRHGGQNAVRMTRGALIADRDDRRTAWLHRGACPQPRSVPEWLVPLGGTIGWPSNGAVSNLAGTPSAVAKLRRELRAGQFDVVHVHEPVAPVVGWDALTSADAPVVGTFHCYSESRPPHAVAALMGARRKLNRLAVRIAVSDAAAWTGRRFYGGEYRIVPNGVAVPAGGAPAPRRRAPDEPLEIVFVGQAVDRKGLAVLLRAFEALRGHVPARLVLIGASEPEVAPLLVDAAGVTVLGRVSDVEKRAALERADVLVAPSLGGESFGMVLTESFAAGTPVVASDIAGYRDVVRDGVDGLLVPRGDATALAETLRDLALAPERTAALGAAAGASVERYSWPQVAAQVAASYEDARAVPQPEGAAQRAALRIGLRSADLGPRRPARRRLRPPRRDRAGRARRRRRVVSRARADRRRPRHAHARDLESGVGPDRPGADVRLDAVPRRLVARDPPGRAAGLAPAPDRRLAGPRRRRADVRDSACTARRAVARADRRAPARAAARGAAGRDRHACVADAAQPAGAGDPRHRDVLDGRSVRRPPAGAGLVRAGAGRRARRGAGRAGARALRPAAAIGAGSPLDAPGARRGDARAARPRRLPAPAARHVGGHDAARRVVAAAGELLGPDGRAGARPPRRRPRRGGGRAVRRQRERRAPRHAVERRRVPGGVHGGADRRLRDRRRRRARLRDHPAGRRGRDGGRARRAGAREGGPLLAGGPAARHAHRPGRAVGAAAQRRARRRGARLTGPAHRLGQVTLEVGRDRGREPLGRQRGERLDADHVACHQQADDLRRRERGSQVGVRDAERRDDAREHLACHQLADHARGRGLGGCCTDQPEHRLTS